MSRIENRGDCHYRQGFIVRIGQSDVDLAETCDYVVVANKVLRKEHLGKSADLLTASGSCLLAIMFRPALLLLLVFLAALFIAILPLALL